MAEQLAAMDFLSLVHVIEGDISPHNSWLLRSDKERGYFANIMRTGTVTIVNGVVQEHCYPSYAETPEAALAAAYERFLSNNPEKKIRAWLEP